MNLLEQLQKIWVNPAEMWMDETLLMEEKEPEEQNTYQMIDQHIMDMQPMLQWMESEELLYLVWQIISLYNSNIDANE